MALVDFNSRGKDESRSQANCPKIKEKEPKQKTKLRWNRVGQDVSIGFLGLVWSKDQSCIEM